MAQFIINADDFGYSRGVNYGIIDAHVYGIVNSATLMVNMPGAQHAAELAKQHPSLKTGVHLTLTCGKSATAAPSLSDADGFFTIKNNSSYSDQLNSSDVEKEWDAQIRRFLSFGLTPSHLDSHHHVHSWPVLEEVIKSLSKRYNLPVRRFWEGEKEGLTALSDVFRFDFYGDHLNPDYFSLLEETYQGDTVVEVMCHPAYADEALLSGSSYSTQRVKELSILIEAKAKRPS